jgi:cytidine deaminase
MLSIEYVYMRRTGKVEIDYTIVPLKDLGKEEATLMDRALQARFTAHAPYSDFQVGAAALLADGTVITGSNQENRSFPAGLCAERVCLYHASSNYPDTPIEILAVVAFPARSETAEPAHPCGGCRQVMMEMQHKQRRPFKLLMLYPNDEVLVLEKASDLMPFPFESEI